MRSILPALPLGLALGLVLVSCDTLESLDDGGAHEHRARASAETARVRSTRMAFPTGDVDTSAVLVEKRVPAEVWAGKPFDAEIVVTNVSALDLEQVVLLETLDENLVLESSDPAPDGTEGLRSWQLGELAPGEVRTISLRASAVEPGDVATCLSVTYTSALCSTITVVRPALGLTVGLPEAAAGDCEEIALNAAATNPGTGVARDVTVRLELPEGLLTRRGERVAERELGDLGAGETREAHWTLRASQGGEYSVRASARAEGGLTAAAAPFALTFRLPDLRLAKTGPAQEFAGRNLRYVLTVTNEGDGVAEETVVADELPPGAELVEASEGGFQVGRRVRWQLGRLEPGAARELRVTYRTDRIGAAVTRATAAARCNDEVEASTTTQVVGRPAVRLEVVDETDPVEVGSETTYLVRVANQGTAPATRLRVAFTVPGSAAFLGVTGPTGLDAEPGEDGLALLGPLERLAPKDEAVWRVRVRATSAADARFKVSLTGDQLSAPVEESEATNYYE